jgi:tRNA A-37 threonylcarbamoyl transferase component Bud32
MGLVLEAFDPALKRRVAIKVLAPNLAADRRARQRFAREAQLAAAVRHENIVTIHAIRETRGLPFLVMEYVAGGSLQDYLDLQGAPDWRAAARLGAEIAGGLAAAHARGLIHRDIKPSNILLEEEKKEQDGGPNSLFPGRAKIGDFGLARAADEARLTQTGTVMGTPMYMAPEQARCEALDARADLFSLGSVLYTLCTGQEPFPPGSPVAVLRQVCDGTPPPVRDLNPAVPGWLAATVERLHAKRPADRFAGAAEVAELLRYNLEHPDRPRPVPARPAAGRRGRRRLLAGALAAGLLLASGLLLSESLRWTHLTGLAQGVDGPDRTLPRVTLAGHTGPVWSVAFAPDGHTLATGSDDATLRLWDPTAGRQTAVLSGHGSAVLAVAFAHSGKFLVASGGDGTLRVWDAAGHKEERELQHHNGSVRRAPLSPDDRTVALASSTQGVELWDLGSGTVRQTLAGRHGTIWALAFSPDGQTLATGDTSGSIRLWDLASGVEQADFPGDPLAVRAVAFSPDGRTLASAGSGDKDVKLGDVAGRQLLATLSGGEKSPMNLAFSPDGRLLAAGGRGGLVNLWEVPSGRPLATLEAHQGSVWAVAFSPDGRTLATAGEDRLARLWDLEKMTR